MSKDCLVSFITPVFNEELNIARMLANLYKVLRDHPEWKWELILIEDGSHDDTRRVLEQEIKQYENVSLFIHEENQGYARSLKDGISRASGEYIMYVGADEEFDCTEIPSFIAPLLLREADLVLGVRWQRNAYQLFRFFLSVIYIFILNYAFKMRINDYNWSQAWPSELLRRIDLKSNSLFILPEIIVKAHDLGYKIKEIPSNHRGRQAGKSSVNMGIMGNALWDAVKFTMYRNSSRYRAEKQA